MDKFKLISHRLNTHQYRPPSPRYPTQLFNILEKCTQILRQDRIWYRNHIKENDKEVLLIFDKYKRNQNLQQLQIELRKHITKIKQKQRKDQLNHFKQNFCLGVCTCQKKNNIHSRQSQRFCRIKTSNNNDALLMTNKFTEHQISQQNCRTQNDLNIFENQQNEIMTFKGITNKYNEDLEIKFAALSAKRSLQRIQNKKKSIKQSQSILTHNDKVIQKKPLQIQFVQNPKHNQIFKKQNYSQNKKQIKIFQKQVKNGSGSTKMEIKNCKIEFDKVIAQNKKITQQFEGRYSLKSKPKVINEIQQNFKSIKQSNYTIKQSQENLFTPPQLLQQCRKIIEKSSQSNKGWDSINKNDIYFNSDQRRYSFPQQILKQNSNRTVHPQNPFKTIELNYQLQNTLQESRKNDEMTRIFDSYQYAEDIFDLIIKYCPSHTITTQLLREIIEKKFGSCKKTKNNLNQIYEILKLGKSTVRVNEIGLQLQKMYKPKKNNIRNLQCLIDVNERGYFTYIDYCSFLQQLLNQVKESQQKIILLAQNVFRICDMYLQQKIYYWNIYFIKNNEYVHQFLSYLQQFQFQIVP